jgi:Xaa-Pro aminopeptidase
MLTAKGCADRRARLWQLLPRPCEALIITAPESLNYLAGYAPPSFVFNTVESAAVLVLLPDRSVLITDNLVKPFLDPSCVDELIDLEWYTGKTSAPLRRALVTQAVLDQLPYGTKGRLGVETVGISILADQERYLLDPLIRSLRRAKDEDELALILRSVRAGEAGHSAALEQVRPGMTELDMFLLVQAAAARALAEPAPIYGDFVSGPRCETERGGPPSQRVIERGDLFLMDFSVVVHGYRADFTNTFAVGAEPTCRQRELAWLCLAAFQAGESLLRPGIAAKQIDAAVRGHFAAHDVDAFFPSHTGHGLGLGHPEPPFLVPHSSETLVAGDVIALEPGLYVPGVGGMRFERNYLITAGGHELLTHHHMGLTL